MGAAQEGKMIRNNQLAQYRLNPKKVAVMVVLVLVAVVGDRDGSYLIIIKISCERVAVSLVKKIFAIGWFWLVGHSNKLIPICFLSILIPHSKSNLN